MLIVKRDGRSEPVAFDKITARIRKLCYGLSPEHVDAAFVAQKVVAGVYNGVTTVQLDDLASETAAFLTTKHPDYGRLAARIAVSNLHKQTEKSFAATMCARRERAVAVAWRGVRGGAGGHVPSASPLPTHWPADARSRSVPAQDQDAPVRQPKDERARAAHL